MLRTTVPALLAFTMLVSILGATPTRLSAQENTQSAGSAELFSAPPAEICTAAEYAGYEEVTEFPKGKEEWTVRPIDSPDRMLYLVTITLGPGKCIPYRSFANQKAGAVVMTVQDGAIEFTAQRNAAEPDAEVLLGNPGGPGEDPGVPVAFGTSVLVEPDEWVSQDDQVWFTYRNPGPGDAVILKVVWADPIQVEGCGGDCR